MGVIAESVLQGAATAAEFLANFSATLEGQKGVGEGVVAKDVAGLDDLADDLGPLLNVASNQKKSRVYLMLGEDIQSTQGVRIVGAIVVGECELLRPAGETREGASVPLSGGRH